LHRHDADLKQASAVLDAARSYAADAWPVFPLRGKAPIGLLTPHGVKNATTDLTQIDAWFSADSITNLGIAIPPGVVVLDVDVQHDGDLIYKEWLREHGPEWTENVPRQRTGNGGCHLVFRHDDPLAYMTPNAPGCEMRRHGHYIVVSPSFHPNTGAQYEWEIELPRLAELDATLPGWLVDVFMPESRAVREEWTVYEPGDDDLDIWAHEYTSFRELLEGHGWTLVSGDGDSDGSTWRHPTATADTSASIKYGTLFVYSPTPGLPVTAPGAPNGITLFSAIALLDFGGDTRRTAYEIAPSSRFDIFGFGERSSEKTGERAPAKKRDGVYLTRASEIRLEPVEHLLRPLIPVRVLTQMVGVDGVGKSTIVYSWAAGATRGTLDGDFTGTPVDVVIASSEDHPGSVILPRLIAADADLERVHIVKTHYDGIDGDISLPEDVNALAAQIQKVDARLLVVDPLVAHLDMAIDSHKQQHIRAVLAPLAHMAEEHHVAVVSIVHFNGSSAGDVRSRINGSKALRDAARSVIVCGVHPEDPTKYVVAQDKYSLGPRPETGRVYEIVPAIVDRERVSIATSKVRWGDTITIEANALVVGPRGVEDGDDERGDMKDAVAVLRRILLDEGSLWAKEAFDFMTDAGFTKDQTRRAKEKLGVESVRISTGEPTGWKWLLPHQGGEQGGGDLKTAALPPCPLDDPLSQIEGVS
jgi:hypothetical protein